MYVGVCVFMGGTIYFLIFNNTKIPKTSVFSFKYKSHNRSLNCNYSRHVQNCKPHTFSRNNIFKKY